MNVQRLIVVLFLLLILGSIAAIFFLPVSLTYLITKEWGPLENAQVIFYMTGALVSWIYARQKIWDGGYQGSLILLIFAMRELDFQKKFTGISITRTKYYFHSDAALTAKLLSAFIVISILVLLFLFIKNNIRGFYKNVRARNSWSLSVIAGLLSMFLAIFLDSITRILGSLGIESVKHGHLLKNPFEELFELAIPFFFLNALLLYGNQTKKQDKPDNPEGAGYSDQVGV
jgi:hypothetical protein